MAVKTIKYAIIGGGLMGRELASASARWCHLTDIGVRPELVAVCDKVPAAYDWFRDNFKSVTQYTADYKDLLANPEVQAIYCAVPHNLHETLYKDIIEAGKHMLGEKPFGIDKAANASVMETIRKHPEVVVRCSSEFPFFPAVQKIVAFVKSGRMGDILEVDAGFLHSSDLDPEKPINWKRMISVNGEYGCMGDLGLHVFHVPLRLGWKPMNVRAILSNIVTERKNAQGEMVPCETWDNSTLLCEVACDKGSFPLTARMQRIAPGETNTWYITVKGTKLSARFTTKRPRSLEIMEYDRAKQQAWQTLDLGYDSVYKTVTGGIFEFGFSDSILQMMAAFFDQVGKGNDAQLPFGCATPEETAATHEIFTAALESQKRHETIAI